RRLQVLLPVLEPLLESGPPETMAAVHTVLERLRERIGGHGNQTRRTWAEDDACAAQKALHSALSLLDDPSESTRLAALCRLEASPPSDAAAGARLGMALQDDAEAVRAKAVQLLKGVPSECLQGALVVAEGLHQHPLQSVRRAAAAVLELDPARSDSLTRHVALLKDEDPNLRCAAAEALGEASKLKELEELGGRPLAQFL
ncbi:AP-5 complex subunit beta-1 (Adaptor-related protein complex 5 beta subunit), partial [Durusdinium trenchii]